MTEKEPAGQTSAKSLWQEKRKEISVGILISLLLVLLGAWGLHRLIAPPAAPAGAPPSVATADVRVAADAHPGHDTLMSLIERERLLKEELKDAMTPLTATPPVTDSKPFDDSVWQKNAQNVIGAAAEIMRQKKRAAEEYRNETREDYEARRKEIDAQYLNEILNIQLKLQNQDNLHLTAETVAQLTSRREALQMERGSRQFALMDEWEKDIAAHAEESVRESREELRRRTAASKAALEMEAAKHQSDAQARNAAAMEAAMRASTERQQTRSRLFEELRQCTEKRISLEGHIMSDIAGQAAKLAILHHYSIVIANPAPTLASRIPWSDREEQDSMIALPEETHLPVVGVDTIDITEELAEEVGRLPFTEP